MKKITIIGTIGKDAEIKNIGGRDTVSFSVAVNTGKGDNKVTEWFSVLSSQTTLQPYLRKGDKVYVEGSPKFGIYNEQVKVGISSTQIQLLGGGAKQENQTYDSKANYTTPTASQHVTQQDDDLPF